MNTKKAFWISYDLGLRGDYPGLYAWLDTMGAKECGDSIAFFTKKCNGDPIPSIKKEIKENVNLNKTDRIYLIYLDDKMNKIKGTYLFGRRKRAPWEGYGKETSDLVEDSL